MVRVYKTALKHGLSENEVRHAWAFAFTYKVREKANAPATYLAIGPLRSGELVELIALTDGYDWLVIHAMTPPTPGFLREFEGRR